MTAHKVFADTPGGNQLFTLIGETRWRQAAEQLNSWNREGISAAFKELQPRQIESLYLGAVANDKVGEGSQVAQMALNASPELAKAREAVIASGISMKEFVDYAETHPDSRRTHGEVQERYGFGRYWTIRSAARSIDDQHLGHLFMEEDRTIYIHPSGRQGTNAEETSRKVAEYTPPSTAGLVTVPVARALGADEKTVQAVQQATDVVGDVLGGVAAIGAQRAQYNSVQSTRTGPVAAEVRPQQDSSAKEGGGARPQSTRSESKPSTPETQRATSRGVSTAQPSTATARGEVSIDTSTQPSPSTTTVAGSPKNTTAPGPGQTGTVRSPYTSAPADVGDKASRARGDREIENAMRATREKNTHPIWGPRMVGGAGAEAASRVTANTTTIDLNKLRPGFPQFDLLSRIATTSVKWFGLDKPPPDPKSIAQGQYDPIFRQIADELKAVRTPVEPGVRTKVDKAADAIAANRDAIRLAGTWPPGLAKDAKPEQIAKFLNRQGVVAIPGDYVDGARAFISADAKKNPAAYGLTPGSGLEKGIERLVTRVQSVGRTSAELTAIAQRVYAKPPPATPGVGGTPTSKTPAGQSVLKPPPALPPKSDEVKSTPKREDSVPSTPTSRTTP